MLFERITGKKQNKYDAYLDEYAKSLRELDQKSLVDEIVDNHKLGRNWRVGGFVGLNMFADGLILKQILQNYSEAFMVTAIIIKNIGPVPLFVARRKEKAYDVEFKLAIEELKIRATNRRRTVMTCTSSEHAGPTQTLTLLDNLSAAKKMDDDKWLVRGIGVAAAGGLCLMSDGFSREFGLAAAGIGGLFVFSSFLMHPQNGSFEQLAEELRERPDLTRILPLAKSKELKEKLYLQKRKTR